MIIGIGNDYVDIRRIEKAMKLFGLKFIDRVFTKTEQQKAELRATTPNGIASTYAKRWAAKEAVSKALGTGIGGGITWKDIEVVNLSSGKPIVKLYGKAEERLTSLTPEGKTTKIDITLTDDYPKALAVVIISAD